MEGGRSRVGKVLSPKIGFLSVVISLLMSREIKGDVRIIPVSISYDKLVESGSFGRELMGGDKTAESLKAFLTQSSKLVSLNFGAINIAIGESFSLTQQLESYTHCSLYDYMKLHGVISTSGSVSASASISAAVSRVAAAGDQDTKGKSSEMSEKKKGREDEIEAGVEFEKKHIMELSKGKLTKLALRVGYKALHQLSRVSDFEHGEIVCAKSHFTRMNVVSTFILAIVFFSNSCIMQKH